IWARNLGRFRNAYFDDMAWVALALGRLARLHDDLGRGHQVHRPRRLRLVQRGTQELTAQLRAGMGDELGGGVWWNTTRDFKNVPATGPVALHLARTGDTATASELVDWMYDRLFDPDRGLFIDGVRVEAGLERFVRDIYTYNQGTVLGTLITLGDPRSLDRAAHLIAAVAARLTAAVGPRHPLVTHGGGDGGLFTGILVRYLALAGASPGLDHQTRRTATTLVQDTAHALWSGRSRRPTDNGTHAIVFSADPAKPAGAQDAGVTSVELSTQLQAWMTLEAAGRLAAAQPRTQR
ncbi:MAG: glycosyl hydrolase, partial [Actinomycetota bacterium]|nr:glycosyl hydrolase [Actinomycetota bacterium]